MIHALKRYRPPTTLPLGETDEVFDNIYPRRIRRIADQHFTPVVAATRAAAFLVNRAGTKVLDVGSGAGKFCLVGASTTAGQFTGIEQREDLVVVATGIAKSCGLTNVNFVHGNILNTDFHRFDAFYLFNPFYENVNSARRMDDTVLLSQSLYESYCAYTFHQLEHMPADTRVVTYYTSRRNIPHDYRMVDSSDNGHLECWIKGN